MRPEELDSLLQELIDQPREAEWLEFKVNNGAPEQIGKYCSALANSALLADQKAAYLVNEMAATCCLLMVPRLGGELDWLASKISVMEGPSDEHSVR